MIVKSQKSKSLQGEISVVADKSLSHRAIILSSLANGISSIYNLLLSDDVKTTLEWAKIIGVKCYYNNNKLELDPTLVNFKIKQSQLNTQHVIKEHNYKFFLNNSGTSARLLMGVMSGFNTISLFYGDKSLQKRPMLRVLKPLAKMGSQIYSVTDLRYQNDNFINQYIKNFGAKNNFCNLENQYFTKITKDTESKTFLPTIIKGGNLVGIKFKLNIPSAQVKSALLLAGLFAKGETTIIEPILTRDHTENMLIAAGVNLNISKNNLGDKVIHLPNHKTLLQPHNWSIPGDFSSSAFIIVAALLVPDSAIYIKGVNLNPLRTGLLRVLESIGANIKVYYKNKMCGEDYGDIYVKYTKNLKPIIVTKDLVASMIDEFPILFCLASTIKGENKFLGIEELRYKESDRILSVEKVLNDLHIDTKSTLDSLTIYGNYDIIKKAPTVKVDPNLDHRIAMSFLVLGLVMKNGIIIKSTETIKTSFPDFIKVFKSLGANLYN